MILRDEVFQCDKPEPLLDGPVFFSIQCKSPLSAAVIPRIGWFMLFVYRLRTFLLRSVLFMCAKASLYDFDFHLLRRASNVFLRGWLVFDEPSAVFWSRRAPAAPCQIVVWCFSVPRFARKFSYKKDEGGLHNKTERWIENKSSKIYVTINWNIRKHIKFL